MRSHGRVNVGVLLLLGAAGAAEEPSRHTYTQIHLGVQVRLVLCAPDEEAAKTAARAAYALVARLEDVFSDYKPASELNRLCDAAPGRPVPISRDLMIVLQRAVQLSESTGGVFDVTIGPLSRLWRQAGRSGVMPARDALAEAAARTGYRSLRLDPAAGTASLERPLMQLDLGAIAKGYIVDRALEALAEHGVDSALIEAGGDIAVSAAPPGRDAWVVEIPDTADQVPRRERLLRQAISTSGDTQRFVELDGVRYSHIVDPRTGLGLTSRVAATVVAPDAFTSDGLATACCLLDEPAADALVAATPGARLYRRVVASPAE